MIQQIKYFENHDEADRYLDNTEEQDNTYLLYPNQKQSADTDRADEIGVDSGTMELTDHESALKNIIRSFKGEDDLHVFLENHGASNQQINDIYKKLNEHKYVLLRTDGTKGPGGNPDTKNLEADRIKEQQEEAMKWEETRSHAYWLERVIRP